MFNTFLIEIKKIFKSKWKILSWFIILFIPTLYGFIYANAYWKPFHNTNQLNVAIVDLDKSPESKNILQTITSSGKKGVGKNGDFLKVDFDSKKIYQSSDQVEEDVKNNKLDAAIVINKDFDKNKTKLQNDIKLSILKEFGIFLKDKRRHIDLLQLSNDIATVFKKNKNIKLISYFNSLKHNYLKGEMTTFIGNLSNVGDSIVFPKWNNIKNSFNNLNPSEEKRLKKFDPTFEHIIKFLDKTFNIEKAFVKNYDVSNSKINSYGSGLSPFFISIALWAGAIVMMFLFKNKRNDKNASTIKHYFGKSMAWVSTSIIQAFILTSALWIQGFEALNNQMELFALNILIGISFALIIQAIAFMFRHSDIGELVAIIILILQLASSSGLFPVETENKIFQVASYIVPFTYTVKSIREIVFGVDIQNLMLDILIILIYPIILTGISLLINIRFDKKNLIKTNQKSYSNFEIDMGDL